MVDEDFIELPGGPWQLWSGVVVRATGFPFSRADRLSDVRLATRADESWRLSRIRDARGVRREAAFADEFDAATRRLCLTVRSISRDPLFREAITWQNLEFVGLCLDRYGNAGTRDSRDRKREIAIASYIQRYSTKNDSIGFFGPVGWAEWEPGTEATVVRPGNGLLRTRTTYFEAWAIEEVAAALARRPALGSLLPLRPVAANFVIDGQVRRPVGAPVELTAIQQAIMKGCDGRRNERGIADLVGPADEVYAEIRHLADGDVVRRDLIGPIETRPEIRLQSKLAALPAGPARTDALDDLEKLTDARDAVARAAGDPDRLASAMRALNAEFERITAIPAYRAHGRTYGGRCVVYEDATRDTDVVLGRTLLAELTEPLSLILHSARWLTHRIGADYLSRIDEYYERKRTRTDAGAVTLTGLLALATRDFFVGSGLPPLARSAVAEMQSRWASILRIPVGVARHSTASADIAAAVLDRFAAPRPQWSAGRQYSPDVLVMAASVDALNRGDFELVLGELHLATNTLESRAIVEQSPDRQRMMTMAEHAVGGWRMVAVPDREWSAVTARTSPPTALLSPAFDYWVGGSGDVDDLPAAPVPASALEVFRHRGGLEVRSLADGRCFPLAEVIGDYLSRVAINAFRLFPPTDRRSPRVSIGRLVVSRQTWRLPARKCNWAFQSREPDRYLLMREWVARHDLPQRAYYSISGEAKPLYVDFTSIALTNVLASAIRRMPDQSTGLVTIQEMLPSADGLWLMDAAGEAYTSELRMLVCET
jgi:Lantibiotic dehydratase, N terminus